MYLLKIIRQGQVLADAVYGLYGLLLPCIQHEHEGDVLSRAGLTILHPHLQPAHLEGIPVTVSPGGPPGTHTIATSRAYGVMKKHNLFGFHISRCMTYLYGQIF